MLTHDDLTFLCELCMKEMALIATAKGTPNLDNISEFQMTKRVGMKLWQMMQDKEENAR